MQIEPLTCAIGAQLNGVSLADAVRSVELFSEIKAALLRHKVLFLRNQTFSREDHVAFARRFGELEDHPVAGSDPEHPGLVRIYKTPDAPNDRYENSWHTDATWREVRPEEPAERLERVDAGFEYVLATLRREGDLQLRVLAAEDLAGPGRVVTSRVVGELERRGIPAFGPIWDS